MKKIYKIALTLAAVFALNLTASAQKTKADGDMPATPPEGLVLDKTIKPDPNKPGSYIINMEAYVEGGIHLTSKVAPADIVLVLDVSGSMRQKMGDDFQPMESQGYSSYSYRHYSYNNEDDYLLYYKHTDGNLYPVYAGYGGGMFSRYYYLYYQANNRTYFLKGNSAIQGAMNNIPDRVKAYDQDEIIWTGVLYSSSRLNALKNAVKSFIEVIDQNDKDNAPDDAEEGPDGIKRLGNQIAIVPFSSELGTVTELTPLVYKQDLIDAVDALVADGGTSSDKGMEEAYNILNNNSSSQFKTVVFFTDGDPGEQGNWNTDDTWQTANKTIRYAGQIKGLAVESEDIEEKVVSNVYSLGVFDNPGNETKTYMSATSSNYNKDAYSMGSSYDMRVQDENGTTVSPSDTKYSSFATDASTLNQVLTDIAGSSGGQTLDAASQSSVMIDVVTQSFKIPDNAGDKLTAYEVANVQTAEGDPVWGAKGENYDVTRSTTDPNEVSVTGFAYSDNWVGWDEKNSVAHGKKLVLEIPIDVNLDAVGGPTVYTNDATKTKIVIRKNEQDPGTAYAFNRPSVALPVTIRIQKQGLEQGESAKFTIVRWLPTETEPATDDEDAIAAAFYREVILTNDGTSVPQITIKGLDPKYYYKIIESTWAWSYQYLDPNDNTHVITQSSQSTQEVEVNPFVFYNRKDENVDKHAESSKRNVLKETTGNGNQ